MTHEIFISVTQADAGLAEAIREAVGALFGDVVRVHFSPSKQLEGGIRHGEDWFHWILTRVKNCDIVLILITPSSVRKPWILWEAGAAYGVAMATTEGNHRKIRPVVYRLADDEIPSPIVDSKAQYKRSDSFDDARALFKELVDHYRNELNTDRLDHVFAKLDAITQTYLDRVDVELLRAPLLELAERYLHISVADWRDRVRRKNDAAYEMAQYVLSHGFPKRDLAAESHEGLLLALASSIRMSPEKDDVTLLVGIAQKVTRSHVKYRILMAFEELLERQYVSPHHVQSIKTILETYKRGADEALLLRIKQADYAMQLSGL